MSRSYHHHHPQNANQKPLRTGPLLVGCVLLLAVPLSVFNIISTTTKTFTRSDGSATTNDFPVTEHVWENSNGDQSEQEQQIRSSSLSAANPSLFSSKYQGQSWIASTIGEKVENSASDAPIIIAETSLAKCEVYRHQTDGQTQDHLIFEEQDIIHIVVMDTQDRIWVLHHENSGNSQQQRQNGYDVSPYFAVPPVPAENDNSNIIYSPVMGYSANSNEAPWYVAHRIVAQILGILTRTTTLHADSSASRAVLDENGIKDGNIPKLATTTNDDGDDWIFLGRHRTMANRGGGFVYSYLLRNVPGSPSDTNSLSETIALSRDEIKYALRNNQFADVRGIASITLALLYS